MSIATGPLGVMYPYKMSPAIIARIELPLMNLRYLGRADWMNSALEAGDIFESEGMMTETNSAAPPIQATIAPMWRTSRTRNSASAMCQDQCWLETSGVIMMYALHCTIFRRKHRIVKGLSSNAPFVSTSSCNYFFQLTIM